MAENPTPPAIGIDLGTTYSCVSVFQNGKAKVISNEQGSRITPSCVGFTEHGHVVGEPAKLRLSLHPTRTVYDVKRLLGRTFSEPVVQDDIARWSFNVVDIDDKPMIKIYRDSQEELYSPEQISSMVLTKMKEIAEEFLGQPVTHAVITVPAYFNDSQRQMTKKAAQLAGLDVLRIVNEPTAAAMAFGYHQKVSEEKKVIIFDLGGGTFDVSILLIDEGILQVLATGGDTHLGGVDFDNRIVDKLVNFANKKMNLKEPITTDTRKTYTHRLARHAEFAKCELSSTDKTHIKIDQFHENSDLDYDLHISEFEEANNDLFSQVIDKVQQVITDSKLSISEIDEVILVGGSTRIPQIQKLLGEYFNGKTLCKSINPDEAVAQGAAIQAAILLGVDSVDPLLLLDVTSHTIGLEIRGGDMWPIILRNSHIPTDETKTATTMVDDQDTVDLIVFQGEDDLTRNNHFLGKFSLTNLSRAHAGYHQIDVTFNIDSDGILNVSAKDKATGHAQSLTINLNKGRHDIPTDRIQSREDTEEITKIMAKTKLKKKTEWIKYLIRNKLSELNISPRVGDEIMTKCLHVDEWLYQYPDAAEDEIRDQQGQLDDMCKDLPPDYQIPGKLPGQATQITCYLSPDQLAIPHNEEEVGEID